MLTAQVGGKLKAWTSQDQTVCVNTFRVGLTCVKRELRPIYTAGWFFFRFNMTSTCYSSTKTQFAFTSVKTSVVFVNIFKSALVFLFKSGCSRKRWYVYFFLKRLKLDTGIVNYAFFNRWKPITHWKRKWGLGKRMLQSVTLHLLLPQFVAVTYYVLHRWR